MDGAGLVPLLFGDAELDGDGGHLDHFRGVGADDVATDHAVGFAVDDQLHQHAFLAAIKGGLHRAEHGAVHHDPVTGMARVGFGEADGSHRRLGKHRAGDGVVVEAHGIVAEHGFRESGAFADSNRREVDAVGDVADGPDVLDTGAREIVDNDCPARVQGDAGGLQAKALRVGLATGGEHHHIGLVGMAAAQLADNPGGRLFQRGMLAAEDDLDAALLKFACQVRAHVVVEAAQDVGSTIKQRGFHTQPIEDTGKFHGDVAAADHQDALR